MWRFVVACEDAFQWWKGLRPPCVGKGANLSDAPRKVGRHRIWLNNSGMAAENLCERSRNKQQPESLLREVQIKLLTKHKFGKLLPKDLGSHAPAHDPYRVRTCRTIRKPAFP